MVGSGRGGSRPWRRPRRKPRWTPPGTTEPDDLRGPASASVGEVIRDLLGSSGFQKGTSLGRLARSWEEVVGDRLARETAPASLDDGGLVVVASTSAWAAQLRFLAEEIRRRANEMLGPEVVRSVRIVVSRERRKPLGPNR